MALEVVALSHETSSLFGCCAMAGVGGWIDPFGGGDEGIMMDLDGSGGGGWDAAACSSLMLLHEFQELDIPAADTAALQGEHVGGVGRQDAAPVASTPGRRKRRRTRTAKNKEEVESQRMTHIAVERNRRKQMNEYLGTLRSLMPPSYAQRGDQASIVGGAINFVKELEQLVQSLEAHKRSRQCAADSHGDAPPTCPPFANFFTFPQYSMSAGPSASAPPVSVVAAGGVDAEEPSGSKPSAVADVEVTMVESHANLRVLSRRRPRQLLRLVAGLQGHQLTVLHLNMTSAGDMVLYSLNLKVEDDCQLTSVDEIATAAHQIVEKIQEDQGCSSD